MGKVHVRCHAEENSSTHSLTLSLTHLLAPLKALQPRKLLDACSGSSDGLVSCTAWMEVTLLLVAAL